MKYKYSIILGLASILAGFIPLGYKNNKDNITYTIYSNNIVKANQIKEELMVFYKEYCYSFSFVSIDQKIADNINSFKYKCEYSNHNLIIYDKDLNIKMTGYLFKSNPSSIDFKYYFSITTRSIPEAISTNVATFSVSDQIW